ncbi:hypothetical protein [Methanobrevibacter sp.]|uniref:hypothetical protein n=1 Tax=Methanobrevibacter sp. TaxID=66852 RepID=UPI00262B9D4B|nr:hypothetical protein [uncultured Methanobrevibacter sp.]
MNHPSLYPKKKKSFTQKHTFIILFSLCVLVVFIFFMVAIAINDPSIYTSLGGI